MRTKYHPGGVGLLGHEGPNIWDPDVRALLAKAVTRGVACAKAGISQEQEKKGMAYGFPTAAKSTPQHNPTSSLLFSHLSTYAGDV